VLEQVCLCSGWLDHCTIGRQFAAKHREAAVRHQRLVTRKNDRGIEHFGTGDVLAQRVAVDRAGIEHQQILDRREERTQSACIEEIFHQELPRRTNVRDERRDARQPIEAIER
jgi:hypothetical protein